MLSRCGGRGVHDMRCRMAACRRRSTQHAQISWHCCCCCLLGVASQLPHPIPCPPQPMQPLNFSALRSS